MMKDDQLEWLIAVCWFTGVTQQFNEPFLLAWLVEPAVRVLAASPRATRTSHFEADHSVIGSWTTEDAVYFLPTAMPWKNGGSVGDLSHFVWRETHIAWLFIAVCLCGLV